jgi:hypothetical protein
VCALIDAGQGNAARVYAEAAVRARPDQADSHCAMA